MARLIRFCEETLPAILLAIIVAVLLTEVFARYVLLTSFFWVTEVATICLVWQVYLASIGLMRSRRHVTVDIVREKLPVRARGWFDAAGLLLLSAILAVVGWQAFKFAFFTSLVTLPATHISRRAVVVALFVSCLGMLLHSLAHLIRVVGRIQGGDPPESPDQPSARKTFVDGAT